MHSSFNQYHPISAGFKKSNIEQAPVQQLYSIQIASQVTENQYNSVSQSSSKDLGDLSSSEKTEKDVEFMKKNLNNNTNTNITDTNKCHSQPVNKIILPPINEIIKGNDINLIERKIPVIKGEGRSNNNNNVFPTNKIYTSQKTHNNVPNNIVTTIFPQTQPLDLGSPLQQYLPVNNNLNKLLPIQTNITSYSLPNAIKTSIVPTTHFPILTLPLQSQLDLQNQQQQQEVVAVKQNFQIPIFQPCYVYDPKTSANYQTQQQQPKITLNKGYLFDQLNCVTPSLQQQYISEQGPVTVFPVENCSIINPPVFQNIRTFEAPKDNSNNNNNNLAYNKINKKSMKKVGKGDKNVKNKETTTINFGSSHVVNGGVSIDSPSSDDIPSFDTIQANLFFAMKLRKQCPVCGKICSRPSTLKTHYLIHSGDTPFKCTWEGCKKAFNVKSNMIRHLKLHQRKLQKGLTNK